jgi:hypothetical protein
MDPALDPAFFVSDLSVYAYYFLEVQLHHFSKIKRHKTVGIKVFLTIFA